MMINYYPSKEERLIMSKCNAFGIVCYPVAVEPTKNPLVKLEVNFKGVVKESKQLPFEQKYLSYKVNEVYVKFYEKYLKE